MTIFTIDEQHQVRAFPAQAAKRNQNGSFATLEEFVGVVGAWPVARLVQLWNGLPGVTPVKKFTDRKSGIARLWHAIHKLAALSVPHEGPRSPKPSKCTPRRKQQSRATATSTVTAPAAGSETQKSAPAGCADVSEPVAPTTRAGSKTAIVLALLRRERGATAKELMKATGWQAHSVRGFLSGTVAKKMQLTLVSTKDDSGERTYLISA